MKVAGGQRSAPTGALQRRVAPRRERMSVGPRFMRPAGARVGLGC